MCRHIGYIGNKKLISEVLIDRNHSLIEMAYKPKEMLEANLNADGFGIGWHKNSNFYSYKNTCPIWNDENLGVLSSNISSDLIIGNVRSATILDNSGTINTHPFLEKNFMFSHNGYIKNFDNKLKKDIINLIETDFLKLIKGNTDSEYIFTLFRQNYYHLKDDILSVKKTLNQIKSLGEISLLNFLIATKGSKEKKIIATRYSCNSISPSLYYFLNKDEKECTISSEKMDSKNWKKVPNYSILISSKTKTDIIRLQK